MTIDLKGVALIIAAVCAGIPAVVTAYLQIRAARQAETNKAESIAARAETTAAILGGQAAIHDDVKRVVDATVTTGETP
jgi:hypothetical protein